MIGKRREHDRKEKRKLEESEVAMRGKSDLMMRIRNHEHLRLIHRKYYLKRPREEKEKKHDGRRREKETW